MSREMHLKNCKMDNSSAKRSVKEYSKKIPMRETAWIDGFRGLSALYPCVMHVLCAFIHPKSGTRSLLLSFFVLGGYVSSQKALSLMQSSDLKVRGELLQSLSASAFRRGFRLYLPAFAATFCTAVAAYIGLFDNLRPYVEKDVVQYYFPGMHRPVPVERFATIEQQLKFWFYDIFKMINIWPPKQHTPAHNAFLWTLREEFRASLHLYIVLLSCARLRPWARLAAFLMLGQYHILCGRWEVMLCFLGAAVAQGEIMIRQSFAATTDAKGTHDNDMSIIQERHATRRGPNRSLPVSFFLQGLWICSVYVACVLGFYPDPIMDQNSYARDYPIVRFLDRLIPSTYPEKDKLYNGLGCVIVLSCMLCTGPTSLPRRLFTNKFAQYLGRAFFGIILTQGILLHAGGLMIPHIVWGWIDSTVDANPKGLLGRTFASSERQTLFGLVVGVAVNVPVAIIVGDLFTRTVVKQCMVAIFLLERAISMPSVAETAPLKDTDAAWAKKQL